MKFASNDFLLLKYRYLFIRLSVNLSISDDKLLFEGATNHDFPGDTLAIPSIMMV